MGEVCTSPDVFTGQGQAALRALSQVPNFLAMVLHAGFDWEGLRKDTGPLPALDLSENCDAGKSRHSQSHCGTPLRVSLDPG